MVGLCVALYFITEAMSSTGGHNLALVRLGALVPELVQLGEPWRVLSSLFLHDGLIHLFFNCFTLWQIGALTEQIYGRGRFFILFVLCGAGGGILSTIGQSPHTLVIGASGAIFGLAGCLLVSAKRYPTFLPSYLRRVLFQAMVPFVGYNLLFGLLIPGIDNWSHIGGLGTGAILGFLIVPGRRLHWTQWAYGGVAALLLLWAAFSQWQVQWKYAPEQLIQEQRMLENNTNMI